ncbi:MAG: flagellar hook-basal body complex protein FliE [Candidatus Xenobia bacterium]
MSAASPFGPIGGLGNTNLSPINMNLSASDTPDVEEGGNSFGSMFANALNAVNESSQTAGKMSDKLILGEMTNTHDMAIAGAKAEVMLHLTTQIASKLSSATTQLFQMQL